MGDLLGQRLYVLLQLFVPRVCVGEQQELVLHLFFSLFLQVLQVVLQLIYLLLCPVQRFSEFA